MRTRIAALAILFFLAHAAVLPSTLEDIDSINFALGVRDFDVAQHQPHPPGYPVFIAIAKVSTAVVRALGVPADAPRGLAIVSAVAGALLIPLLLALFAGLTDNRVVPWWAMAIAVCSPLFWFTALRPLSDMTGLAFAIAAQVLLVDVLRPRSDSSGASERHLLLGGLLAGLAAGVRAQTVMLTAPLLLAAVSWPRLGIRITARAAAICAAALGCLAWSIPLIAANGGLDGYLAALGTQAGEDFAGVVMLWTTPRPRVALDAALYSFVWPWGTIAVGTIVLALAAAGLAIVGWQSGREILPSRWGSDAGTQFRKAPALIVLAIAFAPYAVFHLLFHETVTVRYALPLVIPAAWLAACALAPLGRIGASVGGGVLIAAMLLPTLPASRQYAREGSPAFRAFANAVPADASRGVEGPRAIGMHAGLRRVEQWIGAPHGVRVLRAPHGQEWMALVEYWRQNPSSPVTFLADPRRTDLRLFDPQSVISRHEERWTFAPVPYVGGTRPGAVDIVRLQPPGWMLDRGWALTAEIGGVSARDNRAPHLQPVIAWVKARKDAVTLMIGGRNLGAAADPVARVVLARDGTSIASWDVAPGFFFRLIQLPAGALPGDGYVPLTVAATAADGSNRTARVSLEQFDLQGDGVPMVGFIEGWGEPEYNPATAQAWRWMSERATVWVRPTGSASAIVIEGELPQRYFDGVTPVIRMSLGAREIGVLRPDATCGGNPAESSGSPRSGTFRCEISLPADAIAAADGRLTFESDRFFSPAESGAADQRRLVLRASSLRVSNASR